MDDLSLIDALEEALEAEGYYLTREELERVAAAIEEATR